MADDTAPRNAGDRPSERTWQVPTTVLTEQGEEVPSLDNANFAMSEVASILMRLGGVVSIVAKRVEIAEPQGRFAPRHETEMLIVRWQAFVPATPKAPQVAVSGEAGASGE
jgi:hypothetical protein